MSDKKTAGQTDPSDEHWGDCTGKDTAETGAPDATAGTSEEQPDGPGDEGNIPEPPRSPR